MGSAPPIEFPAEPGEHRRPCYACGHPNALAIKAEAGGGAVWMCHRCDEKGGRSAPTTHVIQTRPGLARWNRASTNTTGNVYLQRKGVAAHGLRQENGVLLVPVRSIDGDWRGLQKIFADGGKRFERGTKKRGAMHVIGDITGAELIYIAEGYATAATVHEASGAPVLVAFDAGNLRHVAKAVRDKYPAARLVIAADDDRQGVGNPGRTKAESAARLVQGLVAVPDLADDEGTDFNDLAVTHGVERVRACLERAAAAPGAEEALEAIDGCDPKQPAIIVRDGDATGVLNQTIEALQRAGVEIYNRGGQLVRPVRLESPDTSGGIFRSAGSTILAPVEAGWVWLRMAETVQYRRYRRRGGQLELGNTDPPMNHAVLIATIPDETRWPILRAVVSHPVLWIDGTWSGTAGYRAGLLIEVDGDWPAPGETFQAAEAALQRLREHFRYYPWATPADESVAMAMLLTAVLRPVLDAVPMFVMDANAPGSGKSMFVDAVSVLAAGTRAAVMEYGRDSVEASKRLDGMLLAGDTIIALDNIETQLGGATLCQMITQSSRRIRVMGGHDMVTVPATALLVATGNNLIIRGDLVRRSLVCRLDALTEQPELREIPQNLIAETVEHRRELVAAAHTIVRAYLCAGSPGIKITPFGSFESWNRTVRAALVWLGMPDPVTSQQRLRDGDPEREAVMAFFEAWHATFVDEAATVQQAISATETHPDLKDALATIGMRNGALNAGAIGAWMRSHLDTRCGGFVLRHGPGKKTPRRWRVQRCS